MAEIIKHGEKRLKVIRKMIMPSLHPSHRAKSLRAQDPCTGTHFSSSRQLYKQQAS